MEPTKYIHDEQGRVLTVSRSGNTTICTCESVAIAERVAASLNLGAAFSTDALRDGRVTAVLT